MKKVVLLFLAVLAALSLRFAAVNGHDGEKGAEIKKKEGIMNHDIAMTKRLCQPRGECEKTLDDIRAEQRKNLRIVPYPSGKRLEIHAVDADSMQKIKVNHPEENEGTSHYYKNEIVVRFLSRPTPAELDKIMRDIRAVSVRRLDHAYLFVSAAMSTDELKKYFEENWTVVYTEPHFMYMTNEFSPSDVFYDAYQWNLPMTETPQGWEIHKGSDKVVVAVIDTGVDITHPDLQNNLVSGYNVIQPGELPLDDVGHGTHVAGIIAATVDNGEGVAGLSWYNKIMPVKALDHSGAGSAFDVAEGIRWATDHGAGIINMSLGNYVGAQFLHEAIRYAFERDVVLIAAAGNDNTDEPGYPAAYPEVVAVGATDEYNQRAFFSNYGNYIDVVAPGEHIASTYIGHQYAALSGTSMASPHVAALAAMIRSANPELTNVEVMQLLRASADDLGKKGHDREFGFGRINVKNALQGALRYKTSLLLWPRRIERSLIQR